MREKSRVPRLSIILGGLLAFVISMVVKNCEAIIPIILVCFGLDCAAQIANLKLALLCEGRAGTGKTEHNQDQEFHQWAG